MSEVASEPDAWYKDGLPFTCTRCGHCCTGAPGFVWVTEEEIEKIAAFRREPVREFSALYTRRAKGRVSLREKANDDCVFWDKDRGCTVYPVRPAQCRTWPFWGSNVKTPEEWAKTVAVCPGSGKGELIPVEEILKRVRTVKM